MQRWASDSWYDKYCCDTAEEHRQADLDCGRAWECSCAACIQVREGITKSEWLRKQEVR